MNIFSKIKHLKIGARAKGILSTGRAKLNSLSKKNKRIVAGTAGAIVIGLGGVGAAKIAKNAPKLDKNANSIVTENTTEDNNEIYGPTLNGETPTNATTEEKNDEFLSDKVKDVKIKDEEEKTNKDVKEAVNGDTTSNENTTGYVAYPEGEEIVEKVEYSGNAVVSDGVAYESQEDINRKNNVGAVEFEDNVQYYPGANGEYYLTQEDADNSYLEVYYDNDTNTDNNETGLSDGIQEGSDTYVEVTDNSNFYYDEENNIRWASYEDYLMFTNPSYAIQSDFSEVVTDEQTTAEDELIDSIISDENEEIVYGPDGEVYPSLEAYNEAMAKKISDASKEETKTEVEEETKEETKTEVKEETKEETKAEVKEETKEETKPEVKEETKEETKTEVKEETKEETKPEVKEETKEETKPEVKEETKEEVTDAKGDSEDDMYLDILLDDEGWRDPEGNWWTSEEEYNLVNGITQTPSSKTR